MRLAAQMHCTLEELGERMSAEEFGLWLEFEAEEPLGAKALAIAVAQLRASVANGPLKLPLGKRCFTAPDFYTEGWQAQPEAPAPSEADLDAFLRGLEG